MMRIEETPGLNETQLNCIKAALADWSSMRLWFAWVCLVFCEGLGGASLDLHMLKNFQMKQEKKMLN